MQDAAGAGADVDAAEQAVAAAPGIDHDPVAAVPHAGRVQGRVQPGLKGQVDDLPADPGGPPGGRAGSQQPVGGTDRVRLPGPGAVAAVSRIVTACSAGVAGAVPGAGVPECCAGASPSPVIHRPSNGSTPPLAANARTWL